MKYLFVFTFSFFVLNSYSQLKNMNLLLGKSDQEVINYLDSLNGLKNNPYVKIKRDITNDGDLILKDDFALSDESYYTCYGVMLVFKRVGEKEICVRQLVIGSTEYADSNMDFLKDNFEHVGDDKWKMIWNDKLQVTAKFERKEADYPSYVITYDLEILH